MFNEIKQRRMATEMIRVVHECDVGMRLGAGYYRSSAASGRPDAEDLLKRAARLPYRVEARIAKAIATYGIPALDSALALVSGLTMTDLAIELAPLKIYSDQIKTARQGGATLDEIADHIEANRAEVDPDERVAIPSGYTDEF
jgi:hypothetical protein